MAGDRLIEAARRVLIESGNRGCRDGEPPLVHVNHQAFQELAAALAALPVREVADQTTEDAPDYLAVYRGTEEDAQDRADRYFSVADRLGRERDEVQRKLREALALIRRASPFVNAVAAMAEDKAPALAWLADSVSVAGCQPAPDQTTEDGALPVPGDALDPVLAFPCPECGSGVGEPCHRALQDLISVIDVPPHKKRRKTARRFGLEPPCGAEATQPETAVPVQVTDEERCPKCQGTGRRWFKPPFAFAHQLDCLRCSGSGRVPVPIEVGGRTCANPYCVRSLGHYGHCEREVGGQEAGCSCAMSESSARLCPVHGEEAPSQ